LFLLLQYNILFVFITMSSNCQIDVDKEKKVVSNNICSLCL